MSDELRAALEVLQGARQRVVPIRKWFTPQRYMLDLCDEDACCAMTALPDLIATPGAGLALEALADAMGCETSEVPEWNDSHSHDELVIAFGVALTRLHGRLMPMVGRPV